ncbi:hypothetical protein ED312_14620 [Sinomicrobium pectinilyticum]|uniref:Uncharacterized protein n=1 Tax=Sinomicrobium pectinilyticum TaxID=1084421 RepID=A0A3N0E799_SINP1|nr:hypothetical protein ED312_14620 [Sinomicrobium pectinilyticum]
MFGSYIFVVYSNRAAFAFGLPGASREYRIDFLARFNLTVYLQLEGAKVVLLDLYDNPPQFPERLVYKTNLMRTSKTKPLKYPNHKLLLDSITICDAVRIQSQSLQSILKNIKCAPE